MTPTRRLGWTALAMLALAGCNPPVEPPPASSTSPADKLPGNENAPAADKKDMPAGADDATKKDATEIKAMPTEPAKPAEEPKKDEMPKAEEPKKDDAPKSAEAAKLSDAELAEVKKLPADEQPAAIAQVMCPVSDEKLGSMGTPIQQKIGDKTFYICCNGCKDKVKNKPDEVLAKLAK